MKSQFVSANVNRHQSILFLGNFCNVSMTPTVIIYLKFRNKSVTSLSSAIVCSSKIQKSFTAADFYHSSTSTASETQGVNQDCLYLDNSSGQDWQVSTTETNLRGSNIGSCWASAHISSSCCFCWRPKTHKDCLNWKSSATCNSIIL